MIEQVLRSLNDFFIRTVVAGSKVETDGITVSDGTKFVAGQYILVIGSVLNNGVLKVKTVTGNKIATDETLYPETNAIRVCGMAVPRGLLDIITEITEYNAANPRGISQESLGDYSVTYSSGASGGGSNDLSWYGIFKSRLAAYKKVYLTIPSILPRSLDWQEWYDGYQ